MSWGPAILHSLIDPDLAFLFFFLGLILIVVELLHPGISVPGLLGTIFLVTSVISFGLLPVRLGGVVLLIASAVFFLLEFKHPGFGFPTMGGRGLPGTGRLLLFNSAVPNAQVSPVADRRPWRWLPGVLRGRGEGRAGREARRRDHGGREHDRLDRGGPDRAHAIG